MRTLGLLLDLNTVIGALFLLSTILLMTFRQVQGFLRYFVWQSVLLTASALDLAAVRESGELAIVAAITLGAKVIVIPALLTRVLERELRAKREVELAVNTPTSLLVSVVLSIVAYVLVLPLLSLGRAAAVNLPVGLDALLLGIYTLAVRREAVPQMLAIMAVDNGAFFAGIAIANSPALIELAAGLEGVMVVIVVAILTRTIAARVGTTAVGDLATLKEGEAR